MTVDAREYHRTFLHWPRKAVMMPADIARMSRSVGQDVAGQSRSNGPRPPTTGVPSGMERDTRRFHNALELSGSQFREVQIEEKSDQQFAQFATPWERKWSRLMAPRDAERLVPVVDGNAMVVGYYGEVKGSDMLIGRATGLALIYTAAETIKYHQMYVGNTTLHAGPRLDVYHTEWRFFSVLTDIYGEVTSFEFSQNSTNGEALSTDFPVWGWLKLLQGGLKAVISIRNGFRTLGRQPPAPPPQPPRALPPGPPATAAGGNAPRPGSRTIVSLDASTPVAPVVPPQQGFNTGLGEALQNMRRQMGLPPLPARTVSQLHYIARGRRADREFMDWLLANPNASPSAKFEMMDRIYARWRVTGMPGDE
jgi:hypothetical protein